MLATPDAPVLAATAVGALLRRPRAANHRRARATRSRWWIATGVALGLAFARSTRRSFCRSPSCSPSRCARDLRARFARAGAVRRVRHRHARLLAGARSGTRSTSGSRSSSSSSTDSPAPQGSALVAAWKHEGDFFGGQAGLASPILFVHAVHRRRRAPLTRRAPSCAVRARASSRSCRSDSSSTARFASASSRTGRRPRTSRRSCCSPRRSGSRRGEKWFKRGVGARGGDVARHLHPGHRRRFCRSRRAKDPIGARVRLATTLAASARAGTTSARRRSRRRGDRHDMARRRSLSGSVGARVPRSVASDDVRDESRRPRESVRSVAAVSASRAHAGDNLVLVARRLRGTARGDRGARAVFSVKRGAASS